MAPRAAERATRAAAATPSGHAASAEVVGRAPQRQAPGPSGAGRLPRAAVVVATLLAVAGLAPGAAACPYCSLSQGVDTLVYVLGFLVIPYLVVSGTWLWIRRLLASERQAADET